MPPQDPAKYLYHGISTRYTTLFPPFYPLNPSKLTRTPESLQNNPTLQTLLTNASPLTTNLTQLPLTTLQTTLTHLRTNYLNPYVIDPLAALLTSSTPDLVSIFLLVGILLISLKILDYARRIVMFWVAVMLKMVFWGVLIGCAVWGYRVGFEGVLEGVGWVFGVVKGVVEGVENGNSNGNGNIPRWDGSGAGFGGHGYRYGYGFGRG